MSLVGALSPTGLFASKANDVVGLDAKDAIDQTLATVRTADSSAFAKLSILWAEADGHRVTEDAWGTGEVKEMRFKIGVKDVDGLSMAVGDKLVPLHPTDVITVRMFNGDFAYRNTGTSTATIQLQGTVKTTLLNGGSPTGKLTTATGGVFPQTTDQSGNVHRPVGDVQRVAFVTLGTGKDIDTVAVQSGGARLVTTDDSTPSASPSTAGNMLAKWVKIEGRSVQEYTWGDGSVERIEFQAQAADGTTALLSFDAKATAAPQGAHVLVRNFTGEYLVYQVSGGQLRLRLDGYAEAVTTGAEGGLPIEKAPGIPLPAFEVAPQPARTTDVVKFKDRSTDDGILVYWRWNFGDGSSAALQDPTHRYARPGVYNVTLNVTDDDLRTIETTRSLVINNAEPVPDYDMLPRVVTTDTLVAFTDHSIDPDGLVTNWSWSFGDGQTSYARHPNHHFVKSGTLPVSLTITDDLGGKTTLTKQVLVRNAPPRANFEYAPTRVLANVPIHFHSTSTDKDGTVVDSKWSFGTGGAAAARGSDVTYKFPHPGMFDVTLTVTDDGGDADAVTTVVFVINTPPVPEFTYSPHDLTAGVNATFDGRDSNDTDGFIILNEWTFDDGTGTEISRMIGQCTNAGPADKDCQAQINQDTTYDPFTTSTANRNVGYTPPPLYAPPPPITHAFRTRGEYNVTLCVTDNLLNQTCTTNSVLVNNSGPLARIGIEPSHAARGQAILFADQTVDLDGDPHAIVKWVFDGVIDASTSNTLAKSYPDLGSHTVTLVVQDPLGAMGTATRSYSVENVAPVIRTLGVSDTQPPANVSVHFAADAYDPDNSPGGLNYTWVISDGSTLYGSGVDHAFTLPGDVVVILTVRDLEDGVAVGTKTLRVHLAPPVPDFTWSPTIEPTVGHNTTFNDTSTPTSGPITKWVWDFGDHTSFSTTDPAKRNTTHKFAGPCDTEMRTCAVTLTISSDGQPDVWVSKTIRINSPPQAGFYFLQGTYAVHQAVTFHDAASDPDGNETIDHRVWNFGDGTGNITWNESTIDHTFVTPGQHTVTQYVIDDHGIVDSLAKFINLNDAAPTAAWIVDPSTPTMANTNVHFISQGHATDPDGNGTITFWSWDFGDGTPLLAGTVPSTYQNPVHVFASSGIYRVTLVVGDGSMNSGGSPRVLRVTADHQVPFLLNATLPSGQSVNLFADPYEPKLMLHAVGGGPPVTLTKANLAPATGGALFTLQPGQWAHGDDVQVELRVEIDRVAYVTKNFISSDSDGKADPQTGDISPIPVHFDVPLPLTASVMAEPDDDQGIITKQGPGYRDGTVYHSMTSPFHGKGHVAYVDGSTPGGIPAIDADLIVQLRFIPLYPPAPFDGTTVRDSFNVDTPIFGWCIADREVTDVNGNFTWSATASDCLGQPSIFLPGHWEVRVVASHPGSRSTTSEPWTIFVDPTGSLATLYMP